MANTMRNRDEKRNPRSESIYNDLQVTVNHHKNDLNSCLKTQVHVFCFYIEIWCCHQLTENNIESFLDFSRPTAFYSIQNQFCRAVPGSNSSHVDFVS